MSEIGRPLKFYNESQFNDENELTDFIENHIVDFCDDIFKDKYISHKRNTYLSDFKSFSSNKPRIDLVIKCKNKVYGVEIKNPSNCYAELSRSISQLLAYIIIAKENNYKIDRFVILTSSYDNILEKIIKEFKLPIDIILLRKNDYATWFYDNKLDGINEQ